MAILKNKKKRQTQRPNIKKSTSKKKKIAYSNEGLKTGTNYKMHHTKHGYSYEAIVVDKKGVKYPMKLTKSGYVDNADVRNYTLEAQRDRSSKAIEIDNNIIAKKTFPKKPTPAQLVAYFKHPNRYDMEGIDAPLGTASVKAKKPKISRIADDKESKPTKHTPTKKETLDDVFRDSDEEMWKRYAGHNKTTRIKHGGSGTRKKTVKK